MSKNCGLSDGCDTSSGSIRKCAEHEHDIRMEDSRDTLVDNGKALCDSQL